MKSIVLLSGGLDSVVAAAYIKKQGYELIALNFIYGQPKNEIIAAERVAKFLNAKFFKINLDFLNYPSSIPQLNLNDLKNFEKTKESAKNVWIPARNLVFCSIAASFAEKFDAQLIVTGFDLEEAKTFPDNSIDFVENFNNVLKFSCLKNIKIFAPLINLNKKEIVKLGLEINAPLNLSWSCYNDFEKPCGKCESCLRRKRAFEELGIKDPAEIK